ncbi:hypothetical protein [Chamaesiphon minutus]|uniref:hypothetical protein n=1 Tax=Chamaesiphon minutus TaxID=1173032 RepID=UPI0002E1D8A8|nr:hypothetical protein [Chamaesiphon minutus]
MRKSLPKLIQKKDKYLAGSTVDPLPVEYLSLSFSDRDRNYDYALKCNIPNFLDEVEDIRSIACQVRCYSFIDL